MGHDGLVGVGDAAAALGVSRRTVTRWLSDNPRLRAAGSKKRPRLDLAALRAHAAGLDPDRAAAGSMGGAMSHGGAGEESGTVAALKAEKLREEIAAKRQARRLREGELLERAAVETSVFACFRRVRRKVEMIETWSEDAAVACGGDSAALRAWLKTRLRGFQDELAAAVEALPIGDAAAAEDDAEPDPDRTGTGDDDDEEPDGETEAA